MIIAACSNDIMIADKLEANLKATAMDLMEKSKDMGLIINESKTKNMVLSRRTHSQMELVIGPSSFGRVETFKYFRVELDTNSGGHDKVQIIIQNSKQIFLEW